MAPYAWIVLGIAISGLTTTLLLSSMTLPYLSLESVGLQQPGEFERVFAALLALQREPPLSGTDEDFLSLVKDSRARLHLFYSAMLEARSFRHDSMQSLVKKVLAAEGNNPYYRFAAELGG